MDIEVRQPRATGRGSTASKKKSGGGINPDKTKAIAAGAILVIAAGVFAWQMGLFNFGGKKADPVVQQQNEEEWEEIQDEQDEYWKKYERSGRKRPTPSGS